MSEKKKPAWLTGEPSDETAVRQQTPRAGSRKGPLAEDDTGQILNADRVREAVADDGQTRTVPRVPMPEPGANGPGRDAAGRRGVPVEELALRHVRAEGAAGVRSAAVPSGDRAVEGVRQVPPAYGLLLEKTESSVRETQFRLGIDGEPACMGIFHGCNCCDGIRWHTHG